MFDKVMLFFGRTWVVGLRTIIETDNGELNAHSLQVLFFY